MRRVSSWSYAAVRCSPGGRQTEVRLADDVGGHADHRALLAERRRERGLPGRRRAADREEHRAPCAPAQRRRLRDPLLRTLGATAHGIDLRAHERAIAGHERQQRVVSRIAAGLAVSRQQRLGERGRAFAFEVHDEEADVAGDVDDAQPRVKLQGVKDLHRIGQQHVLEAQVAVAVDDQAATPARQQVLASGAQHDLEPVAQRRHPRASGRRESRRLEIVERGPHRLAKRGKCRLGLVRPWRGSVKGRDACADRSQLLARRRTRRQARREDGGLVVAAHEHAGLDDTRSLVVVAQREAAAGVLHDPDGAQVQARCQAPVEPHLFATHRPPAFEGAVVEERQLDRPLDLQRVLSGDEDPRPVRLVDLDARRAPRIDVRRREPRHDVVQVALACEAIRHERTVRAPAGAAIRARTPPRCGVCPDAPRLEAEPTSRRRLGR